jgi:hypothetical protein
VLRELVLWRSRCGDEVALQFAADLARSRSTSLESFGLWSCELRDWPVATILGAMTRLPALRQIDVATSGAATHAVEQAASILLRCSQLTFLRFSSVMRDAPQAFTALFDAASHRTNLRELHIATSRAFDLPLAGCAAIESVLERCQSLRVLQCGGAVIAPSSFDRFLDILETHNTTMSSLYWGTMFSPDDDDDSGDRLRERRESLLRRNCIAQWSVANTLVATIAIGMASLDLPAYVLLEIVDQIDGLSVARHGLKIRALILVKNRFKSTHIDTCFTLQTDCR